MDAVALPFVEGRLRKESMSALIETTCACCGERLEIEANSELDHRVMTVGAEPVLSVPLINIGRLAAPSITEHF